MRAAETLSGAFLGETTAREITESVKVEYYNQKQRFEAHLSAAIVTHTHLSTHTCDYLDGKCNWDKFVNAQSTADRRELVNTAMYSTIPK
jgi:hypothetical protein